MRKGNVESRRAEANLSRVLYSLLRFPAVRVCSTVWISILVRQVRKHSVQNARVYWRSSLGIVKMLDLHKTT